MGFTRETCAPGVGSMRRLGWFGAAGTSRAPGRAGSLPLGRITQVHPNSCVTGLCRIGSAFTGPPGGPLEYFFVPPEICTPRTRTPGARQSRVIDPIWSICTVRFFPLDNAMCSN